MKKNVKAIITAAGTGTRFKGSGRSKPKQFLSLNNKPVILYSLLAIQKSRYINEIVISSNKRYFDFLHNLALKNKITKLTGLVEGGSSRFISVRNAFHQLESLPGDLILIHDAVRPNIDAGFVDDLIMKAFKKGEVIPVIRVSETVKLIKRDIVAETLDRENLRLVQTPQIFRYKILQQAYKKAKGKNNFTDESSMVEMAGFPVNTCEGKRHNIKITTSEDLQLLKILMKK